MAKEGPSLVNLHLVSEQHRLTQPQVDALVARLEAAMAELGLAPDVEMALVLADDDLLADLNTRYRGKSGPTDVLSFPADSADALPGEPAPLGDVLISLAQAEANASVAGHGLDAELALLAVHGLLHLLGHEDESDDGAEAMVREEVRLGVRTGI